MAIIYIENDKGERREWDSGPLEDKTIVLAKGERIIGSKSGINIDSTLDTFSKAAGLPIGTGLATLLKPLAMVFGKENCSKCNGRKIALNFLTTLVKQKGAFEAAVSVKELFDIAARDNPDAVASRIREMLEVQ